VYELIDAGEGRRLERFGERVVDRESAAAAGPARAPIEWQRAVLRFDVGEGWDGPPEALAPWPIELSGLRLELRPTAGGGLGVYPEHLANLAWLERAIERRRGRADASQVPAPRDPPSILNLFAHTGLATLAAARAGAAVAHLDASRGTIAWARHNAVLSGLADRPVRWLVDDALGFVRREARRGHRYDGIVLDPPSFGRAAGGTWRLVDDLASLLDACAEVAAADAFVLVTAHTTGLDGGAIAAAVAAAFGRRRDGADEIVPLVLEATSGARLELGWAVRRDPA
jgi:23S rRNA (cytosine1962-C5)-methyltransferase